MNIDNIKSQMRRGYLEHCILLILKNKSAYTSDIISELKEAKLIVVEGTLYPLLNRLKNNNLLAYKWEESLQGPPRKYYEITEEGDIFSQELERAWGEINETIQKIKEKNKTNGVPESSSENKQDV
ncbi:MAG: PadR family transcriptional regulator [Paludibacteraceae bacterium]